MSTHTSHRIEVRKKSEFLRRMMQNLAGEATLVLQGDLSRCSFSDELRLPQSEDTRRSQAVSAYLQRVSLRLEPQTVEPLMKQILAAGFNHGIIHIQILCRGAEELGCYDNFHRECVVTGPAVSAALLAELQSAGLIWKFSVAEPAP